MAEFSLDLAFVATAADLGELPLCHARLQLDARYPWIVLVPRVAGARELEDLSAADRARLIEETVLAGAAVRAVAEVLGVPVDKLNVGALGNVTPQLHVHVVGRRRGDPAWPGPVWGHSPGAAYKAATLERAVAAARAALGL
ncbi:diadenosine tetraphosphate hydrolase [Caulobacter sp. Root487D2Y]|uniref:HIT domain-containing protein n=1 Tax=Caulobacter sp. Root487D2Y TaxID=1736547 RepID=UPI0006FE8B15|nr:HIT domain-containing protein [Caulobacter sp. Root487D2Y]KQY35206.1 diadenosine tetraphosphate hydrolase [Caulobacter sp. Root487D2Y]